MTDRFIIDAYGSDPEAVQIAIRWRVEFAREHGLTTRRWSLRVSAAQRTSCRCSAISADAFIATGRVRVEGVMIRLLTTRGRSGRRGPWPCTAVWSDDNTLARIERTSPTAICVIPWSDHELLAWKAA